MKRTIAGGKTLLDPVLALADWAEAHRFEMQEARERFDKENARKRKTLALAVR
jgi:DNA-binding HxlR family transcriptional regulator